MSALMSVLALANEHLPLVAAAHDHWFLLASATDQINTGASAACGDSCNTGVTSQSIFNQVANALTYLIGGLSVIMIIVGGLRYVTSNGDSKQTTAARQTILYAVVGVVVAICSYAIIQFITSRVGV